MQISGYFVNFDLIKKLLIIKCEAQKTSPLIKKSQTHLSMFIIIFNVLVCCHSRLMVVEASNRLD